LIVAARHRTGELTREHHRRSGSRVSNTSFGGGHGQRQRGGQIPLAASGESEIVVATGAVRSETPEAYRWN
jgi:hypothetical protein